MGGLESCVVFDGHFKMIGKGGCQDRAKKLLQPPNQIRGVISFTTMSLSERLCVYLRACLWHRGACFKYI